ncbi:MAG: glycosyltransferase [Anaerolineales bacterium]
MPASKPKIALVHDRLNVRGGAERVLEELADLYPEAPIYTLIHDPKEFAQSSIANREIRTSFIGKLPLSASTHRIYIPLMPKVIERFHLNEFDLIISSSAAFAHGLKTSPRQLHISYIHSPMRYAWHQYQQHLQLGYGALPIRLLLAYLRRWDRTASQRPDHLLTNSAWTASAIRAAFGREAKVINPPVHVENFKPSPIRKDYYLTVSRLAPYKRVDLIARAFSQLGQRLIIVGEGSELSKIKKLAAKNIQILPFQSPETLAALMAEARAFVYTAEEDFGIAAVEAQAAGCPVIAYGRGGLTETVIDGETGLFFQRQTSDDIVAAVKRFEALEKSFDSGAIRKNAERFSADIFRKKFSDFVTDCWEEFTR